MTLTKKKKSKSNGSQDQVSILSGDILLSVTASKGLFVCFKSRYLFLSLTIYFICTFYQLTPGLNASFTTWLTGYKETPRKFLTDDNISEKATPWHDRGWFAVQYKVLVGQTVARSLPAHLNSKAQANNPFFTYYENGDTSCVTRGWGSTFMKICKEVGWKWFIMVPLW